MQVPLSHGDDDVVQLSHGDDENHEHGAVLLFRGLFVAILDLFFFHEQDQAIIKNRSIKSTK